MGYGARQVTDELGNIYIGSRKAASVGLFEERPLNENIAKSKVNKGKIGNITDDKFSLLLEFIVNKEKHEHRDNCEYGLKGRTKWIKVNNITYWTNGNLVHVHKH